MWEKAEDQAIDKFFERAQAEEEKQPPLKRSRGLFEGAEAEADRQLSEKNLQMCDAQARQARDQTLKQCKHVIRECCFARAVQSKLSCRT